MKYNFFKKYLISIISFAILGIMIMIASIQNYNERKSIENNKYLTIAKVYKSVSNRSVSNIYYTYYFNNKEFNSSEFPNEKKGSDLVDKFFEINISKKNPKNSRILLDKEIKDKVRIEKAGFNID